MPKKWLTEPEAIEYLTQRNEGRLATCDETGQPYITPLNYLLFKGKIYIHCANKGKKLDNIACNQKVCFEVSQTDKLVLGASACKCSTRYTSVIVFGTAEVIVDVEEKAALLNALTAHLAEGRQYEPVSPQAAQSCTVVAITINGITGKRNVDPE